MLAQMHARWVLLLDARICIETVKGFGVKAEPHEHSDFNLPLHHHSRFAQTEKTDGSSAPVQDFPVLCDGKYVGYMRSGAFGQTLGASVGLGVIQLDEGITTDVLQSKHFEVEVNERRYKAIASLAPLYDPESERIPF